MTIADDIALMMPSLQRHAFDMTRDEDRCEDLASDTILRALSNQSQFRPGTSLKAWCRCIMRNSYFNSFRRQKFDGGCVDNLPETLLPCAAESQSAHVELQQTLALMERLPATYRDALLLVASGSTYEEAASALNVPSGTLKSWIRRGRIALMEMLA